MIEYPVHEFKTQKAFEDWMEEHHDKTDGIWLRYYKKASGVETITYAQALDVALCFGWIDGQAKSYDEKSYLQKYTPRRKRSMWSKRNTEYVARLLKAGKMRLAGLKAVEDAKADGRWDAAYASPANIVIPKDFLEKLEKK